MKKDGSGEERTCNDAARTDSARVTFCESEAHGGDYGEHDERGLHDWIVLITGVEKREMESSLL